MLFPTINHPHPRRHNSTCQLFREFQSLHSHFTLCCIWLFPFPLQQLVLYLRFSTHSRGFFLCVTACYCYYCTHSTMVELMIMENFFFSLCSLSWNFISAVGCLNVTQNLFNLPIPTQNKNLKVGCIQVDAFCIWTTPRNFNSQLFFCSTESVCRNFPSGIFFSNDKFLHIFSSKASQSFSFRSWGV